MTWCLVMNCLGRSLWVVGNVYLGSTTAISWKLDYRSNLVAYFDILIY